jgi:hypothetical protein
MEYSGEVSEKKGVFQKFFLAEGEQKSDQNTDQNEIRMAFNLFRHPEILLCGR